jgi:hypothetical protein
METLFRPLAEQGSETRHIADGDFGYLSQPEMKDFIQTALDLGWTLIPYEANEFKWLSLKHDIHFSDLDDQIVREQRLKEFQSEFMELEFTNWREEQQALNIINALASLPGDTKLLIWCGNSHLSKQPAQGWIPMGYQFKKLSNTHSFGIDQTRTVKFNDDKHRLRLIRKFENELEKHGGTAGFLCEEAPFILSGNRSADAMLLSTQNDLE